MSDSEADENTCLMSTESTSQLCPTDNSPPMERDLVSFLKRNISCCQTVEISLSSLVCVTVLFLQIVSIDVNIII